MARIEGDGAARFFGAAVALVFAIQLAGPLALRAQTGAQDQTNEIISPRPLSDLALLLEERYAKPVTFEEPVWAWRGDVVVKGSDENARFAQWLVDRRFELPDGLIPGAATDLNAALLGKILDAYHSQNADGTRFKVLESRLGLHIVPAQYHNASGQLVPVASLLDVRVTVPYEARMASAHLRALCDAVTAAAGTKMQVSAPGLDLFFAANALVPQKFAAQLLPEKDRAIYSFVWGAREMSAREALLSLIDSSATTLRWSLLCQPSAQAANRFCSLNVTPLQVRDTGPDGKPMSRTLTYDRGVKPAFGPPMAAPE